MRCKQCGSAFRFSAWVMQCGECRDQYCTKCMTRTNGICYCHKCVVLVRRPPDITELMKLKPKDLQDYLNRHNVTTVGVVEKRELVDLLCNRPIAVKTTKTSVVFNKIFSNLETVITLPDRLATAESPTRAQPPPRPPPPSGSSGSLRSHSLPRQGPDISPKRQAAARPRAPSPPPPPARPTAPPLIEIVDAEPPPDLPRQPVPSSSSSPSPQHRVVLRHNIPKLKDFGSTEELHCLSTKELKTILSFNRVDYKGCVEKTELIEKVERLWIDHREKYQDLPEDVENLCKLCMDAPLDCVLLECGHIATCVDCGKRLAECPICRQYVSRVVRTFKA